MPLTARFRRLGLRLFALWLCALGTAVPAIHAQSATQSGGTWAPLERSTAAPYRPPTPQESVLLEQLMTQAQKEAVVDTNLLELVGTALASDNPHVRTNAFAMMQVAMMRLRAAPGERSSTRRAVLTDGGMGLALDGLRDGDGAVRRYAFTAMASLELDAAQRGRVTALSTTLFASDPEPMVRVVALGWLLGPATGGEVDRALIERAIADGSPSVKAEGFSVLWMRQVPDFVPFVLRKLHDESDRMTRITAAAALLNVVRADPSVVDAVNARLAVETDPVARERLAGTVFTMREILARAKKPGANR